MTRPSEPDAVRDYKAEFAARQAEITTQWLRILVLVVVAAGVWALDLGSKTLAVTNLENHPPIRILGGLVYLQVIRNPGAAFGMVTGMTWLLTLIAAAVVVAIVRVAAKLRSRGWAIALGLVLGGALGNLTDRVLRYPGIFRGWVVDMISVFAPNGAVWPIFNLADSAICTGGVLLVLLALLGIELDGSRSRGRRSQ
ncbi:MAG TPA: signal peptidase II [Pseudonocardia sp.]|jgi:signal peptidase II